MGKFNSSLTRVQPVFNALRENEISGRSWLATILRLSTRNAGYASGLAQNYNGLRELVFEKELPPPHAFLTWLIENPDRMHWPPGKSFGAGTTAKRKALLGKKGEQAAKATKAEALQSLERLGPAGSKRCWWAFEGFTHVDCYLETDTFILLIEGKRTETLSRSTDWYPVRDQLLRNLEVAREIANGKDYVVMVGVEHEGPDPVTRKVVANSLPHLAPTERDRLLGHYLGRITWRRICETTGIDFESLPECAPFA